MAKKTKPDKLVDAAVKQRSASKKHKKSRMSDIQDSEEMYYGEVEEQIRNRFNVPIPVMSGFVEHLQAKIDDPPSLTYKHQEEADLKKARKVTAAWRAESASSSPEHKWPQKDRWAKKLAIFSGRAIFKIYAQSKPHYRSNLEVVDHYDFHCEPRGGGHLENHLFCGQDNIFKTKEELKDSDIYEQKQVKKLINKSSRAKYKQTKDDRQNKVNRFKNLGLSVEDNYTGQELYNLSEWCLTYNNKRYYLLFDPVTKLWVRAEPLKELFDDNMWPYVSWATHEEPKVFWSKSPSDDMRPIHDTITTLVNQELDNREKRNRDKKAYDTDMFEDVAALDSWAPEKLVPVNTNGQTKRIEQGIYQFETPELGGTLNLVQWLDAYAGQKTGITPGAQGQADEDKKVGIFFGELQQVSDRLGLINKSYKEAWEELGQKYLDGLEQHLDDEMAIKLIGSDGIEHTSLTRDDMDAEKDFDINVIGGDEQAKTEEMKRKKKQEAIDRIVKYKLPVNPTWLTEEVLKVGSFGESDVALAMDTEGRDEELMAEAAKAIQDIINGRDPNLNRDADADFMQKIVDYAVEHSEYKMVGGEMKIVDEGGIDEETYKKLIKYAMAHRQIATRNMAEKAKKEKMKRIETEQAEEPKQQTKQPENPPLTKGNISSLTNRLSQQAKAQGE